jgi:hypothetical protein
VNPNTFYRFILFIAGLSLFLSSCFSDKEANPASPKNALVTLAAEPTMLEDSYSQSYKLFENSFKLTYQPQYCDSDGSLAIADTTQFSYQLSDGQLLTWHEYDCFAKVYSGIGSQLENTTWRHTGAAEIPENASNECSYYDGDMEYYMPEPNSTREIFFSNGTLSTMHSVEFCWSEDFLSSNRTPDGCNRYIESTPVGDVTATLISKDLKGGDFGASRIQMEYNRISCTLEWPGLDRLTEATCKAAYEAWQSDSEAEEWLDFQEYVNSDRAKAIEDFEACLEANNFPDLSNDDDE